MKLQRVSNCEALQRGDIVEFVAPFDDEVGTKYHLIEINGDRCVIELICDMSIRPTWTRLIADLKLVTAAPKP